MHPDLVLISNLYGVDRRQDSLRHEHELLVGAVQRAQKEAVEARAALATAEAALKTVQDADRANGRELDAYVQKRDNTRRLIESGGAPNYEAAQKQLESCARIVDELETRQIELMEQADAAAAGLAQARDRVARAETELGASRAALSARDAPIRAELTAVLAEREVHQAALPAELRAPYQELRRKKRPVLVNVADGSCSSCHVKIPPQRVIETQLKKALHACPGCHGWLLP